MLDHGLTLSFGLGGGTVMKRVLVFLAMIYGMGYVLAVVAGIALGGWFYLQHGDQALPELMKFYGGLINVT